MLPILIANLFRNVFHIVRMDPLPCANVAAGPANHYAVFHYTSAGGNCTECNLMARWNCVKERQRTGGGTDGIAWLTRLNKYSNGICLV